MVYLSLDDVERDDSTDLRQDGDDNGEEEEPDETWRLGGAADPPDQPGEEEGEPQRDDDVGENLGEIDKKKFFKKNFSPLLNRVATSR